MAWQSVKLGEVLRVKYHDNYNLISNIINMYNVQRKKKQI